MLVYYIAAAAIVNIAVLAFVFGIVQEYRMKLELERRKLESAAFDKEVYERDLDKLAELMANNAITYNKDLKAEREAAAQEMRRREAVTNASIAKLMAQNTAMAERIAGLKIKGQGDVVDGVPAVPFDASEASVPYSSGLFTFINSVDSDEARTMVEDFVEMRRNEGMADEQILDLLNRGEYDG
jgi:hypothetical protein